MVGPSYKENERLISGVGEREEKSKKKKQTQSLQERPASHGWMSTIIKND